MKHSIDKVLEDELDVMRSTHRPFVENLLKNRLLGWPALKKMVRLNPPREFVDGPQDWQRLLWAVLDTARLFNPSRIAEVREDVRRATEISTEIERLARELTKALRTRDELCERYNLSREADFHPVDMLYEASYIADHHPHVGMRFRENVMPTLTDLDERHDLRSWPRTADVIEALANAQVAHHAPIDDAMAEAIRKREVSVRSFWRALLHDLETLAGQGVNIGLSDQDFADLTSAIFDDPSGCTRDNFARLRKS